VEIISLIESFIDAGGLPLAVIMEKSYVFINASLNLLKLGPNAFLLKASFVSAIKDS